MSITLQQCLEDLRRQKNILIEIDLNQADVNPHSWLWKQISPLFRPVFEPTHLMVFTYKGAIDQSLLDHVQKILAHLDISNHFVLILTDDHEFAEKAKNAQRWSTDAISIPYQTVSFPSFELNPEANTDFSLPSTMCMAPWARLEIAPDGTYRPCCAIAEPISDPEGVPMTVYHHTLEQVYHSNWLTDLRHQLRKGKKPSVCQKCWYDESMNRKSIRQHLEWDLKDELFNIDWDVESTQNLRSWHLSLGNTCNLKCRICNPRSSSRWAVEILGDMDQDQRKASTIYRNLKTVGWAELGDLPIWQSIQNNLDHVIALRFTGGEPLLLRHQFELVEHISHTPRAKKIDLAYTTNGTVTFPESFLECLARFRNVSVSLSIDDVGSRFEYQRSGASWAEVQKNVLWYADLKSRLSNYTLNAHCTVSIMNVYYLPELIDWLQDQCFDFVRLNVLQSPRALSITAVNQQLQIACLDRLTSRTWPPHIQDQIDSIAENLRRAEVSDGVEFCDTVRAVDIRRHEDFVHHHREVADLMGYRLRADPN